MGYRGYGHSEGKPSEEGIKLDCLAIFDYALAHPKINNNSLYLFGRSLGGAVAVYLASQKSDKIKGIILENTFSSIPDMVDQIFKYLSPLKNLILRIDWNSLVLIKEITNPILFISGESDQIVPPVQMDNLFKSAQKSIKKEMFKVEFGTHNETWMQSGDEYFSKIKDFIETVEKIDKKKQE